MPICQCENIITKFIIYLVPLQLIYYDSNILAVYVVSNDNTAINGDIDIID